MASKYKHTQPGWLIRTISVFWALGFAALAVYVRAFGSEPESAIVLVLVALSCGIFLALFHSLTVTVSDDFVRMSYGVGLIHKSYLRQDIESVKGVRTRWYHGWGIRKIIGGWMYNISGFDAVEVQLRNDRMIRIGTDEPQKLMDALQAP